MLVLVGGRHLISRTVTTALSQNCRSRLSPQIRTSLRSHRLSLGEESGCHDACSAPEHDHTDRHEAQCARRERTPEHGD